MRTSLDYEAFKGARRRQVDTARWEFLEGFENGIMWCRRTCEAGSMSKVLEGNATGGNH